ncbi:hypothetical protein [Flavisolibacter tropicus]|uniref:Uncharacterized protein n=1 Tax=Flavisolibacter tropicus TaxID=1492898 RepID=A0A172TV66_9BACT|nr:hypothetical protein [Flavisolibacter tropicus]ANE51011.1 hypothetical protein SY85_11355 [Flavisolibacter tropicus]
MHPSNTVSQVNEFIAKRDGWQYKVYAIFFSTVLALMLIYFHSQSWFASKRIVIVVVIFALITAYLWYSLLDKTASLIVNHQGIWPKRRKVIPWNIVQRFYFESWHHKVASYFMFIETTEHNRRIKLNVSDLDKTFHEIAEAINQYSNGYNIEYGGITRHTP